MVKCIEKSQKAIRFLCEFHKVKLDLYIKHRGNFHNPHVTSRNKQKHFYIIIFVQNSFMFLQNVIIRIQLCSLWYFCTNAVCFMNIEYTKYGYE